MTNWVTPYSPNSRSSTTELTNSCASSVCEIPALDSLKLPWADKLALLTYRLSCLPQAQTPVEHEFRPGLYLRTMRIPARTLFLGRAHTAGHKCELLEGTLVHVTEHARRIVEAPFSLTSTPGYHMVFYTLTEVCGRTVHPNDEESREVEQLERQIFAPAADLIERGRMLSGLLT